MQKTILASSFMVLAVCTAAIALSETAPLPITSASAPADEYFGKMKLSYLGINNSLKDAAIMAGDHTTFPVVIVKIQFAEDALLDWQRKYPSDPQLARSLFLLSTAYLKVWTPDGQTKAEYYLFELRDKYPKTFFGKQAKSSLSKGLTMHVFAASQPCQPVVGAPTPTPAPAPTADPKKNIRVDVEPGPCFTPPPAPAGQPIPVPTVPGAPGPGPLSTPAGITPTGRTAPAPGTSPRATPTPTPTPTPPAAKPTPTPAATVTPAPSGSPTASAAPSPTRT
jgi:hypothetical protein